MNVIYDQIGNHYDTTRKADPHIVRKLADLINIEPNKKYLDIACGTGNYTCELSKRGGQWIGFDQSEKCYRKQN